MFLSSTQSIVVRTLICQGCDANLIFIVALYLFIIIILVKCCSIFKMFSLITKKALYFVELIP